MDLTTAIVLAGGRGMRLRPYTEDLPKPMIDIEGQPILYWIARWLARNEIKKMVIGVAHQKEKIYEWLESADFDFNMDIIISEHFVKSGTGGGIKNAIKNANIKDKCFLAMNGDELTDLSLVNFLRFHKLNDKIATILGTPLKSNFGVLEIGENNLVIAFKEKPTIDNIFINSGVYLLKPEIEPNLPWEGNIEQTAFVNLAKKNELVVFRYFGFWRTVNTEKDLEIMRKEIKFLK
jgi:NDP-sugar pyrophosphorylase family protein